MADEDDTHRKGLRRRDVLAVGAAGAAIAGIGYGTYRLISHYRKQIEESKQVIQRLRDDPFDWETLGSEAGDIDQRKVDTLYKTIYDDIERKLKSLPKDKRLVVLVGENHVYTKSLLVNLLIADACKRLGIVDIVDEGYSAQQSKTLAKIQDNCSLLAQNHYTDDKGRHELSSFPVTYKQLTDAQKMVFSYGPQLSLTDHYLPKNQKNDEQHGSVSSRFTCTDAKRYHAGDPARAVSDDRYDPQVEQAMVDAVKAVPRSCIASYGLAHLPYLAPRLQDDPSLEVMVFNTGHERAKGYAVDPKIRERAKQINELPCNRPILDGKPPDWNQAVQIMIRASLKHRESSGEITGEQRIQLQGFIDRENMRGGHGAGGGIGGPP